MTRTDATDALAPPARPRVRIAPIEDADLPAVGKFLATHYPPDTGPEEWADAWKRSVNRPGSEAPNHGFLMRADDAIVGAYPAIYSTRIIGGRREKFCNLAVWCIEPEFRMHGLRLLKALLAQPGWHFTDLTPVPGVQALNQRFGFVYFDTTMTLVPNVIVPSIPRRTRVTDDPALLTSALRGEDLRFYQDHSVCRWAQHLLIVRGDEHCYVLWRREKRRRRPLFATVQYISNPDLFRRTFPLVGRWLLARHGAIAMLVELRVAGGRIRPSLLLKGKRQRMFRSPTLGEDRFDYLYSEITAAP